MAHSDTNNGKSPADAPRGRLDRWRLNAPDGYHWTDDEVLAEKWQSFCNGVIAACLACPVVVLIVMVVMR